MLDREHPKPAGGAGPGDGGGIDMALVGGVVVAVLVGIGGVVYLLCAGGPKKRRFKGDAVFLLGWIPTLNPKP